jgi:hypothetical protein
MVNHEVVVNNAIVRKPSGIKVSDSLSKINDIISDRIKKWDCFDLDAPLERLDAVKRVIVARDLEWRNMEYPEKGTGEDFVHDGIVTLVVGVKGADFEDHERRR